ncbi:uncharacterized protein [Heptranchias perlo]|uniref:uncharacterized protein isoform X2 n=1 Tax=Heptranchias perlo TaxID=212740 RepID=UPI00355A8CA5
MSIMWSLMKISRGQQFSLVLCVLCLIVQWSCHCSAEDQAHGPSITATNTNRAHPDVPSTIKSSLDKSNVTATPEVSNTSAPNSSAQSSSNQLTTESDINETGVIFQGNQSIPSVFNSTESISTNLSSTTHSDSFNGRNGAKSEMQDKIKHSKTNQPVVLISLLTCGLILAAIILAAYYRVNKRSWSPQSKRLRTNQMHMRSQD